MMPFYSYDVPHTCGPEPAICCQFDFRRLRGVSPAISCPWGIAPQAITSRNVAERARMILDQYRKKAKLYAKGKFEILKPEIFIPKLDKYIIAKHTQSNVENFKSKKEQKKTPT